MSNIHNIIAGWINYAKDEFNILDEPTKKMSERRLSICHTCPIRTDLFCDSGKGGCGCPIVQKSMSPQSECPKGYWDIDTVADRGRD